MHNDARVLDNGDGTLGWIFTLRNCDGSRKSQQIYYMQSGDNGLTWSSPPVGIVTGPVTIGGATPAGGFSLSDVVMVNGQRVVYFNAADAQGALQIGGSPPPPVPSAVPVNDSVALILMACALLGVTTLAVRSGKRPHAPKY